MFEGFRKDNPRWIILFKKQSIISSNITPTPHHYITQVIIPKTSAATVGKRRIILPRAVAAAGSICQDFLVFQPMAKEVTLSKNIFSLYINPPKNLKFRIPSLVDERLLSIGVHLCLAARNNFAKYSVTSFDQCVIIVLI